MVRASRQFGSPGTESLIGRLLVLLQIVVGELD